MTPRKRYSFFITDEQAKGLKQLKRDEDRTESEHIRLALDDYLQKKGAMKKSRLRRVPARRKRR